MKKYLSITLLSLVCLGCHAHRPHHRHPHRNHRVVVVTPAKPAAGNRITARDRLNMAIAYLSNNPHMNAATYSKITGLPKATAKAELEAFAHDGNTPIGAAMAGKKKVYVLTR